MKTLTEAEYLRTKIAKKARSFTFPPELLPEAEDPDTAEVITVVYPEVPFQ